MKWFKHETDAHTNLKLQAIVDVFGFEIYGYYWLCIELVGLQGGDKFLLKAEKFWKNYLKKQSGIEIETQDKYLEAFANQNLIDKKALNKGNLSIPKLGERSDDYTKRIRRVSEQGTDNVHLEEKKEEEIKREKKRTEKKRGVDFLIKKLGEGIDQENVVKALEVLGVSELTDSQMEVVESWLSMFPSRDYKYHALKCKTWWKEKGKNWSRPISAFSNWLDKTKADEHIIKRKDQAISDKKQKEREVEAVKYKDLSPEKKAELDAKMQEIKNKISL